MVETTQTKPLLGNQATTATTGVPLTGTGLNNPMQAPPSQKGVLGTGLSGATNATTGVPLTTTSTTGAPMTGTGTTQQHGVLGKIKDALTGHHSTGTTGTTGYTGSSTGLTGTTTGAPLASSTGFTGQSTGFTGQSTGLTGQSTGFTGQSTGFTGQSTGLTGSSTTGSTWSSGSPTFGATGPMASETVLTQQKTFVQPTTTVRPVSTQIINEKPVLERVEKIVHKDVVERPHIIEQHEKEFIEVHEQPIEKRILHPSQEFHVQEQELYETVGRDLAESERLRLIEEMRQRDMNRRVDVQEHQDVRVTHQAPTVQMQQELRKEIIQKPIVTEIHEQPVIEVHEQNIHKTVYEKPIVSVVREAPIVENVITSSVPLSGLETTVTRGMQSMSLETHQQPIVQQQTVIKEQPIIQKPIVQPVIQQPMVSTTIVEKSLTDVAPHITANKGINPPVTRK